MMPRIIAYVPAGQGTIHKHYTPLLQKAGVENKALIPLGDKPMIQHVLEALDESKHIQSIIISGLTEKDLLPYKMNKPVEYIEAGETGYESIVKGINYVKNMENPPDYLAHMASDIPLITGAILDRVLEAIDWSKDYEIYQNWVKWERISELYPGITKVPMKLKTGWVAGGDFYIIKPTILNPKRQEMLEMIMANRKNFTTILRLLSLRLIYKYLRGKLTMKDAAKRIGKVFDLKGTFYITDAPETCLDLDYEKDLVTFDRYCSQPKRKIGRYESVEFVGTDD